MEFTCLSKEDVELKEIERKMMIDEKFQNSDASEDDDNDDMDELVIKPTQSSKLDSILHHRHKNKRRHSKKSSKRHHHHSHKHRHSHSKLSDADLYSKRNRKMERKSLHYRKSRRKIDVEASINDLANQNIKSKELMKDVMEKHIEYQEITDVRNIKLLKGVRETDDSINRKGKRNTNSLDELLIEWRKKRLLWLQHYKKQESDLQYKNNDKEMSEKHESGHMAKCSTNVKNGTNHLEIETEEHWDFISPHASSEEESMDYEENEKSEDLTGEESDYEKDEKEENVEIESNNLNEKVLLKEQSPPTELVEETKVGTTPKEEILNVKVAEENNKDIVSPKKSSQQDDIQTPTFPVYCPAIQGCRSIDGFHVLNRIEEGTYGVVYRAQDKQTSEIVALKRLKMEREKEGFPITSLREINTLLKSQHPNIVTVREIVVGSHMDRIYIVMDYVEHDLKSLMKIMPRPFSVGEVKTLLMQLLCAVAHLHDNWILHRDLKTSNLLLSHQGILKVGDFGLAREYGSPLKSYTPVVVTLWYRAPELLLGAKKYSTAIDMWSVGCVFAELLTKNALFPGKSELDQINRIFKELGTPSERIWPGYNELPLVQSINITRYPYNNLKRRFSHSLSDMGFDLLNKFLTYNPTRRMSAEKAKSHEFFNETPKPVPPNMFPTWPAKSEQEKRKTTRSPKAPIGATNNYSK